MVRFPRLSDLTRKRQGISAWALALALLAVGIMARFALSRWLEPILPFLTFFPAVIATTLLCGWRQGTFVLILSAFAAWYFFIPPSQSFTVTDAHVALIGFLAVGAFDVVLVAALVDLVRRLEGDAYAGDPFS